MDLVLNVEDFDVESKFERYGCGQGDRQASLTLRLLSQRSAREEGTTEKQRHQPSRAR